MSALWFATLLVATEPVLVTWAGHLETADGVVDGDVSAAFIVIDEATGQELSRDVQPTFAVVDGDFVLDVAVPGDGVALLTVIVNGETFPPVRIDATAPVVAFADVADAADLALDATALDGIEGPVLLADLAPGATTGVDVAFDNVTGVPADFFDGDDGLVFVPDASFSFVDGVLSLRPGSVTRNSIGAMSGADLADNSVLSRHIREATLRSGDIVGTLPLSRVAPYAIGLQAFSKAPSAIEVFEVNVDRCDAPRGTLQVGTTCQYAGAPGCTAELGNTTVSGFSDCTGVCRANPNTPCTLPSAGFVVFP